MSLTKEASPYPATLHTVNPRSTVGQCNPHSLGFHRRGCIVWGFRPEWGRLHSPHDPSAPTKLLYASPLPPTGSSISPIQAHRSVVFSTAAVTQSFTEAKTRPSIIKKKELIFHVHYSKQQDQCETDGHTSICAFRYKDTT